MAINWSEILSAAIPAATQLGTTVIQNKGAQGAADTQSAGAKEAMAVLAQIWAKQQQSLQPYQYAGQAGLSQLMRGLGIASGPSGATSGGSTGGSSSYSSPMSGTVGNGVNAPSALNSTGVRALSGAATGAGIGAFAGPLGAGVGAAIGGGVGALSAQFGKGRHEADSLVPIQNQVAAEVDRITKAVDAAKADGTLTHEDLQTAISTVQGLQKDFGAKAAEFGRAGPGGVATLAKYFDPMVASWQEQLSSLPAQSGNPAAQSGNGTPPGAQNPGDPTSDPNAIGFGELNKTFSNEDFIKDPGYDFRMTEGLKGVQAQAGNMLHSGGTLKALERYGQGFASNEYQNAYGRFTNDQNTRFNRLATVAGFGERANSQSILAGNAYGAGTTSLITGSADAQANAQAGNAANWADLLNTGGVTLQQILAQQQQKKNQSGYNPQFPNGPQPDEFSGNG